MYAPLSVSINSGAVYQTKMKGAIVKCAVKTHAIGIITHGKTFQGLKSLEKYFVSEVRQLFKVRCRALTC